MRDYMKKTILTVLCIAAFLFVRIGLNIRNSRIGLPDKADRVMAVSKIWSNVKEFYPCWTNNDIDWDLEYDRAVKKVLNVKNTHDYLMCLSEFNALIEDGHSDGMILMSNMEVSKKILAFLPFQIEYIENKYIITATFDEKKYPLGAELVSIDGHDTLEYLENHVGKMIGIKTPLAREYRLGQMLNLYYPEGTQAIIKLRYEGQDTVTHVKWKRSFQSNEKKIDIKNSMKEIYESSALRIGECSEDILYVQCFTVEGLYVYHEFVQTLKSCSDKYRGIIVDFRNCDGGNSDVAKKMIEFCSGKSLPDLKDNSFIKIGYDTNMSVICESNSEPMNELYHEVRDSYLMNYKNTCIRGNKMREGKMLIDEEQYEEILKLLNEEKDEVTIPKFNDRINDEMLTVMLIDHKTGSAIDCVASMAKSGGVLTIGTRTNGATGNLAYFDIGNGYRMGLSLENVLTPEGEVINNKGIEADIFIEETVDDLMHGRDTQLNFAIKKMSELIEKEEH